MSAAQFAIAQCTECAAEFWKEEPWMTLCIDCWYWRRAQRWLEAGNIPHVERSRLPPYSREDEILDQVRSGIGGTLDEVRDVLRHDLVDVLSGALSIEGARHFYRHSRR